jgi:two-component system response regulator MprA
MPPSGVFDGTRAPTERILCVDHDPALCKLLARRLTSLGYRTATATSAADALRTLASGAFDAIVTDFRMPHMNGLELARATRAVCPDIVVFLLTGDADVPSESAYGSAGIAGVFRKPPRFEELAMRLRQALARLGSTHDRRSA